jgi:hypothetical protein
VSAGGITDAVSTGAAGCAIAGVAVGACAGWVVSANGGPQVRITHAPEPTTAIRITTAVSQNTGPGAALDLDGVNGGACASAGATTVGCVPGVTARADASSDAASAAAVDRGATRSPGAPPVACPEKL